MKNLKAKSSILFVSIMWSGLLRVFKKFKFWIAKKILVIFTVFCYHFHLNQPLPISQIRDFEYNLALRRLRDPSLKEDVNVVLYLLLCAHKAYLYRLRLHNLIMQGREFDRKHREREKKFVFRDRNYYFSLLFVIIVFLIFIGLLSNIIV